MAKNKITCLNMFYIMFTIMFCVYGSILVPILVGYYKSKPIPVYKLNVIQHNLESTPIIDIISGEQCKSDDTSNILGYYYGFDSGFKYKDKSYSEDYRKEICYWSPSKCITINAQRQILYNYFKKKGLCTSKRPDKNYFDYIDSSVDRSEGCPKSTRKCGRLDNNRNLCIKTSETCPINDIVYNNQQIYINDSITYKTIQINENEFLHYTNQKTDNYIITNLTVIGGADYGGFPCGSNDNNDFRNYSLIEKNNFCLGDFTSPKYYFFRNLSTISLKDFYEENYLNLSYLPEYKDLTYKGNMTLFSTGFFSLSEDDIENLKNPNVLEKNNEYSKSMEKYSYICYITNLVMAGFGFLVISLVFFFGNALVKLIIQSIFLCLVLLTNICAIIEIAINNNLYELTGNFPDYLSNAIDEMKNNSGYGHFWSYFPLLIFTIIIFIIYIIKYRKEKKKDNKKIQSKLIEQTPSNTRTYSDHNEAPPIQDQFQYSKPTPYV